MLPCARERLKNTLTSLAQYKRHMIQAQFMHNLSFVYANKAGRKNRNFERPKTVIFITRLYSNQGGWDMSVF